MVFVAFSIAYKSSRSSSPVGVGVSSLIRPNLIFSFSIFLLFHSKLGLVLCRPATKREELLSIDYYYFELFEDHFYGVYFARGGFSTKPMVVTICDYV